MTKLGVTQLMDLLLTHEHKFSKDDSGTYFETTFQSQHHQKTSTNKSNNGKNKGASTK